MGAVLARVIRSSALQSFAICLLAAAGLIVFNGGRSARMIASSLPLIGVVTSFGVGVDVAKWNLKAAATAAIAFAIFIAVAMSAAVAVLSRKPPTFDKADDFLGLFLIPAFFGAVMVARYQSRKGALRAARGPADLE
jgi:hypothetical protein